MKTFLRLPAVMAATGYRRSAIYEKIAAGEMPAPVKLGPRASAWDADEIAEWQAGRIEAREADRPAKRRAALKSEG